MDSKEAQDLYLEIVNFMEFHVNLYPIPIGMRSVPVLVVDMQSMAEQAKDTVVRHDLPGRGTTISAGEGIVRGLTISTKRGHVRYYVNGNTFSNFNLGK
jgi:hypothetical protein